ncbi:hemicentin-1-like protein, partial [Dinothrombium tinctorium]
IIEIKGVVNTRASLPCNVSTKNSDEIQLVFWYKNKNATGPPIYTLDIRSEQHSIFVADHLRDRAFFNITVQPPMLILSPLKQSDNGFYSCRADYKWSRTQIATVKLIVFVPPRGIYIRDEKGQHVYAIAGPYDEDSNLNLTCIAENGAPPPSVLWYLNGNLIDKSHTLLEQRPNRSVVVKNELIIPKVTSNYSNSILTCQASDNHHSSLPISTSLRIDMNLKPKGVKIVTPNTTLKANKKIDALCTSWGSQPAAKITWILDGKEITKTRLVHSEDGNRTQSSFTLIPSANDDQKLLVCRAENHKLKDVFVVEDVYRLNIHYKPKLSLALVDEQQTQFILEGNMVIFNCSVKSNPATNSTFWLFNDKILSANLDE